MMKTTFIIFACLGCLLSYAQDSTAIVNKNKISISSIHCINSIYDRQMGYFNRASAKNAYTTSFEISYERSINKKFDLLINAALERREHKVNDALFRKYVPTGSHGTNWQYVYYNEDIVTQQLYFVTGIYPIVNFISKNKYKFSGLLGVNYCRTIYQDYQIISSGDYEESTWVAKNNVRFVFGGKIDYNLSNRFTIGCSPFYNFFLTETKSSSRFYAYGTKLSLGYKW